MTRSTLNAFLVAAGLSSALFAQSPNITSFTASPSSISAGGAVTLSWSTSGASILTMNQGIGIVTGLSSKVFSPSTTRTYILTATNASGTVARCVTVSVATASAPAIVSFTASPTTIVPGGSSTLAWNTSGATSLTMNQGVGSVTGMTSKVISPSISTTYTLTATNAMGTVARCVTVIVAAGAASQTISSFTASPRAVPAISTSWLPNGQQHESYSATLAASGGSLPYVWSVSSGNLPVGLSLSPSTGVISGIPSETGFYSFTVRITDINSRTNTLPLAIMITSPGCH